eukprot:g13941.t1
MPDPKNASKLENGAKTAYWGYKAFQALAVMSGDFTALGEIGAECFTEGLCESVMADPGMVVDAAEAVKGAHGGMKAFQKGAKNFLKYKGALSNQVNSGGGPQIDHRTLESAGDLYSKFTADGSGGVSLEEYVNFSAREGVPRSVAETMFFQADVHGRGKISLGEWKAMMAGRAGRDKSSFNCAGHHGLTQYVAVCNGMACDFCFTRIRAGEPAKGCRLCDCDACASCAGLSSARTPPPPPPRPPPVAGVSPSPPPFSPAPRKARVSGVPPGAIDCRRQHGLVPFTVGVGSSVYCNWCEAFVPPGKLCFGCRECDMDCCGNCVVANLQAPDGNVSGLACPGRHGLALEQARVGCLCDFCRKAVATGSKVYSCRICGVDACVACVWKDHRRSLSTGGAFTCEHFRTHATRPLSIDTPQQLNHRCNWCMGAPSLGHTMMRCEPCDCDVCALCMATVPTREAKVRRVRAAANAAQPAATTNASMDATERLTEFSIGEKLGPNKPPPRPAVVLPPSQGPLSPPPCYSPEPPLSPPPCYSPEPPLSPPPCYSPEPPLSPPPCYSAEPQLPPPPRYGAVAAPPTRTHQATAAEEPALPAYHATAGLGSSPVAFSGDHAAGEPPYQDTAAISSFHGGRQFPSYSSVAKARRNPPQSAPSSSEWETPAKAARAADATESPFEFDSVVRVLGVEDPEVQGKLLTVIGFEADGGGSGTVVLSRRGRVVRVPVSKVYQVDD